MGSILTNGVFLPAEGERNCYEGLAANWTVLDRLIGGYNAHIGNTTIHVTAEDKQAWNGKADASALTAHTGDTTIHVTAEDKQAWNNHVADTVKHVTAADKEAWNNHVADTVKHVTAEDKQAWNNHVADTVKHVTAEDKAKWDAVTSKADDSDVVHKSGNETIAGSKTFSNIMRLNSWVYFTNSSVIKGTIPQSTVNPYRIYFGSGINYADSLFNIDTSVSSRGVQTLTFRSAENVVNGDDARLVIVYDPNLTQPRCIRFKGDCLPSANNTYECGTNSNKWKTFNGLNPSSLGMPDLDNGIDISSYLDTSQSSRNYYTPPVNGWIAIKGRSSQTSGVVIMQGGMCQMGYSLVDFGSTNKTSFCALPVVANVQVEIWLKSVTSLDSAKFFPCLGNV